MTRAFRIAAALTLLTSLVAFQPAWAQRVKITLADGRVVEGTLLEHKKRVYRVRVGDRVETIPERRVRKMAFLAPEDDRIDVDCNKKPLSEVMATIGKQAGVAIAVDPAVAAERVTISLQAIPWRAAVDVIARMSQCDVSAFGDGLYVSRVSRVTVDAERVSVRGILTRLAQQGGQNVVLGPRVDGTVTLSLNMVPWPKAINAVAYAANLAVVQERGMLRVKRAPLVRGERKRVPFPDVTAPPPSPDAPETRISVAFKDVELGEAMDRVGRQAGVNVVVHPTVKAKLTLTLDRVPWLHVVEAAARMTRCRIERKGGGILLLTQAKDNLLRAKRAPAAALFRLLAQAAGKSIVIAPEVKRSIDVNLRRFFWDDAWASVARAYGYRVVEAPDLLIVVGTTPPFAADQKPAGDRQVPDPRTRAFRDYLGSRKLQAVLLPGEVGESPVALIDGRTYTPRSPLQDRLGNRLPVRVQSIRSEGVVLQAMGFKVELALAEKSVVVDGQAKDKDAFRICVRADMHGILAACQAFRADCDRFPISFGELRRNLESLETWRGPYFKAPYYKGKFPPISPSGSPYVYRLWAEVPVVLCKDSQRTFFSTVFLRHWYESLPQGKEALKRLNRVVERYSLALAEAKAVKVVLTRFEKRLTRDQLRLLVLAIEKVLVGLDAFAQGRDNFKSTSTTFSIAKAEFSSAQTLLNLTQKQAKKKGDDALANACSALLEASDAFAQEITQLNRSETVNRAQVQKSMRIILGACDRFRAHCGRFPNSLRELYHNDASLKTWQGPYLSDSFSLKDPWDSPYVFKQGGLPIIESHGSGVRWSSSRLLLSWYTKHLKKDLQRLGSYQQVKNQADAYASAVDALRKTLTQEQWKLVTPALQRMNDGLKALLGLAGKRNKDKAVYWQAKVEFAAARDFWNRA